MSSLFSPTSIFIDNNDTLYIVDRDNHRVVKYYANTSIGVRVAGNLTRGDSPTQLAQPRGVVVDQLGNVIVADSSNFRIQKFIPFSNVGTTLASNSSMGFMGPGLDLQITENDILYMSDWQYHRVIKFYPNSGTGIFIAGTGFAGSAANEFNIPHGIFIDKSEHLYVADTINQRVQMWPASSISGITVAGINSTAGSNGTLLDWPIAVIADNNG